MAFLLGTRASVMAAAEQQALRVQCQVAAGHVTDQCEGEADLLTSLYTLVAGDGNPSAVRSTTAAPMRARSSAGTSHASSGAAAASASSCSTLHVVQMVQGLSVSGCQHRQTTAQVRHAGAGQPVWQL